MQDTGHRALEGFDFARLVNTRIPALLVVDANGCRRYALSAPTWHDAEVASHYRDTPARAFDDAILQSFDTLEDLAAAFSIDADVLTASIADWNALVRSGDADRFGRPKQGRDPILHPPFRAAPVVPIVSNTQGGPAHDAEQRVLDAFGTPITGLYEAGEIGSVFGHIYMSGGNLAECFVGGRIAGRQAAQMAKAKQEIAR